jgi:hypothetical protein
MQPEQQQAWGGARPSRLLCGLFRGHRVSRATCTCADNNWTAGAHAPVRWGSGVTR